MAFSERITLAIDVITGSNTSGGLSKLTTDLKEADGAFGKLRVAGGAAFDFIKQNAAAFAVAGGTALAGFAAKAVGDFQEVALGAGKLRDSLGVTAEEASRLQEVAGDLGIGVDTLESAMGKMNRAAADTPDAFDEIGAAIARNHDGTVNVTQTFLNAIEALNRIPDATKRADAAQKIFGRGWQDMAELVEMGATGVREAMSSVEKGKIVGDAQIAKAREFRDRMDELKGTLESLTLEIGEALVPALESIAPAVEKTAGAIESVSNFVQSAHDSVENFEQSIERSLDVGDTVTGSLAAGFGEAARQAARLNEVTTSAEGIHRANFAALEDTADGANDAEDAMSDLADVVSRTEDNAASLERQWQSLNDEIDSESAWIDIEDQMDRVGEAAQDAWNKASSGAEDATAAGRNARSEVLRLKQQVADYGREVLGLPARKVSEILALIDRGSISEARRLLDDAARNRSSTITARVVATGDTGILRAAGADRLTNRIAQSGGPQGGGVTLVGEQGPELVDLPAGAKVHKATDTRAMLNGRARSGTSTVGAWVMNVTINSGADAKSVIDAIKKYQRFNGPGWRL